MANATTEEEEKLLLKAVDNCSAPCTQQGTRLTKNYCQYSLSMEHHSLEGRFPCTNGTVRRSTLRKFLFDSFSNKQSARYYVKYCKNVQHGSGDLNKKGASRPAHTGKMHNLDLLTELVLLLDIIIRICMIKILLRTKLYKT